MKLLFALFCFCLLSCNPHGESEIDIGAQTDFTPVSVNSSYDLSSSASFSFTATDVAMASSQISLATTYTLIDDFNDASNTDWSSITQGGTMSTLTESGNVLNFECDTSWAGVQNTAAGTFSDYIAYGESTVTAWESGTQVVAIFARIQDQDNLYMAGTWNGNHYIYRRTGGTWNLLTSTGGFATSAGVTYAMKYELNGTSLSYKIWDISGAEPGSYQLTATDGNYASGDFGLACYRDDGGTWDNARSYPIGATTDYLTTSPTITFPNISPTNSVSSWDSLSVTENVSGSDEIRYDISLDGGATFVSYQLGSWATNGTGYSDANSLADINTNLAELAVDGGQFQLRAYLYSDDGSTTPSISAASLTYTELQ